MIGIVVFLHFGAFRLLSVLFRLWGVNTAPIMNAPLRNFTRGVLGCTLEHRVSIPIRRLALLPLARRIGLPAAAFIIFILSGLLHEAVISLPARAGLDCQLCISFCRRCVAIERSCLGRRQGLGKGMRGWLFVVMVTIGPLYWLFHPGVCAPGDRSFMNS